MRFMKGKNNSLVLIIVVAIIVGGAGFFGGMQYQKSQRPAMGDRQFMMGGPNGQGQPMQGRPNMQGMAPVSGEVISSDDESVTVKMQDGSSKILILSSDTAINKSTEGTKTDLKTGERITAFGTENSDGSVTAQNISIGGNMMMRGGPPGGSGQQPPQNN